MDSETFKEYLEKRYYDQLNFYDKSSGRNQKKYRYFQWILIILSAITPVLAALDRETFKLLFVVVVISADVAILTTGLKTFQYQELWANYRATCEQLKRRSTIIISMLGLMVWLALIRNPSLFQG
ncbi:MAG TPA: DUF4231 domain-containing protein [Prolixibacteraceae bacterium]|nr:DUF4231 domain-containing protein [Prolixibacteraceae bacterium]